MPKKEPKILDSIFRRNYNNRFLKLALISTLDKSDKEIDELWAKEAEVRIDEYDQGKIRTISLENVLQKYR